MITNDRQYKIAKNQAATFQKSLDNLSFSLNETIHPILIKAQEDAIKSQLADLLFDIEEYEALREGNIVIAEVNDLKDLPIAIIKARIANGLTQADLANALEMKEQQIQRYESEKYETASLKTLIKIASYLKLKINADVQIKEIIAPDIVDIKHYPFKQIFQRKWFDNFRGSYNEAVKQSASLLQNLFDNAGLQNLQFGLNKKKVRAGSSLNQYALNIWYARVLIKAKQNKPLKSFDRTVITENWLRKLATLSKVENAPELVPKYLIDSGIGFVIESQLEGTYLDGAALLIENNYPVIALTLRHDRLDNFWFVLFHEIAHIYLHLGDELEAIFDDLDINIDGIENEADKFALNALIPEDAWRKSLVRFSPSEKTIINQAQILNVNPALVAGRIRREKGNYYLFNDLIGQGEVRKYFISEL